MFDGEAFGREVVEATKAHIEKCLVPILARLDALERRIAELASTDDVTLAIAAIPAGPVGVDPDAVALMVAETVAAAVAAIPAPQKGEPGEKGEPGRDGIGLAGAIIDRSGNLVITTADGGTCELGQVVGNDGAPGRDGFGFDDLDVRYDGERTFTFRFARANDAKEFVFVVPVVLDRGVWKDGAFTTGDGVSYGGSFWIAQRDTADKPDNGSGSWRLAVKRGRDGKDFDPGNPPKPRGPIKVG